MAWQAYRQLPVPFWGIWMCEMHGCVYKHCRIFSYVWLPMPRIIQFVGLDYTRIGRYEIYIRFISTYKREQNVIWQYLMPGAFFPTSCYRSNLCHLKCKLDHQDHVALIQPNLPPEEATCFGALMKAQKIRQLQRPCSSCSHWYERTRSRWSSKGGEKKILRRGHRHCSTAWIIPVKRVTVTTPNLIKRHFDPLHFDISVRGNGMKLIWLIH